MRAFDRLQQWEAGAGAGTDAAGRPVYTGPNMMYMGPREHSATQAEHEKMKIAAAKDDPQGMLIRQLLEQMKNPTPGLASVKGLMGSYNAPDMRINMQDPRQAQG
jgi:hypothetical protein